MSVAGKMQDDSDDDSDIDPGPRVTWRADVADNARGGGGGGGGRHQGGTRARAPRGAADSRVEDDDDDVFSDDDGGGGYDDVENDPNLNQYDDAYMPRLRKQREQQRQRRRRRRGRGRAGPPRKPRFDPRFAPTEQWKAKLFQAIRRGNLPLVQEILSPEAHRSAINFQMFNMGMDFGGSIRTGATLKLPRSSTALHIAAWCGQGDIVRWLLNAGADPAVRDGLHNLPMDVAATTDCKLVLGASRGILELNDKVEITQQDLSNGFMDLGDRFQIKLARLAAELGEIDYKIENAVRECAREEVLELRAALARKLHRELKRFERSREEITTDPLVWTKIGELERYGAEIKSMHHDIDEIRTLVDNKLADLSAVPALEMGEVEDTVGVPRRGGGANERRLAKEVEKLRTKVRAAQGVSDGLHDEVDALTRRLNKLEMQVRNKPAGGCCVVM